MLSITAKQKKKEADKSKNTGAAAKVEKMDVDETVEKKDGSEKDAKKKEGE